MRRWLICAVLLPATLYAADVPAEVLARVVLVRDAGRRVAAELWPDWDPSATPLGVYQRDQYVAVVGAQQMPAPFERYAASPIGEIGRRRVGEECRSRWSPDH